MALVASRNEAVLDVDWTIFERIHHLVYELHDWLISTTNSFPAQVMRNTACYDHSLSPGKDESRINDLRNSNLRMEFFFW